MRAPDVLSNRHVVTGARWLLGLIFLASSLGKIADPGAFADSIAAYRIVPLAAINIVAIVMLWTEFLVGLSLLNGVSYRSGALLAALMTVVFILAAASAIARGLDIECGCFTVAKTTVGWGLIARNLLFLALGLIVLLHRKPLTPRESEGAALPAEARELAPEA